MEWFYQNSINLANAGFSVLLIAVALSLLRPMETEKRLKSGCLLLGIGVVGIIVHCIGPYCNLLISSKVLREPGLALLVGGFIQIIYWRVERRGGSGKEKWHPVNIGVVVTLIFGSVLVVLSAIFSNPLV